MNPGCSGTVDPNSSMIAGPVTTVPGGQVGAPRTGVSTYPSSASKQTGLVGGRALVEPVSRPRRSSLSGRRISGRVIGPIPDTRRFTHSTCWVGSPEKS